MVIFHRVLVHLDRWCRLFPAQIDRLKWAAANFPVALVIATVAFQRILCCRANPQLQVPWQDSRHWFIWCRMLAVSCCIQIKYLGIQMQFPSDISKKTTWYMPYLLTFFLADIWHIFWHSFWHSIWTYLVYLRRFFVVEVRPRSGEERRKEEGGGGQADINLAILTWQVGRVIPLGKLWSWVAGRIFLSIKPYSSQLTVVYYQFITIMHH